MLKHLSAVLLTLGSFRLAAQTDHPAPPGPRGHQGGGGTNYFNVTVPAHPYDLILCRPEANRISLCVLASQNLSGQVNYGTNANDLTQQTPAQSFQAGAPASFTLAPLAANTRYYYTFRPQTIGRVDLGQPAHGTFTTTRAPGATFTFTLTADCHLDEHTSPRVYEQTLQDIRAEQPDFHLDLGNLFMTDKHHTRAEAAQQYVAQRYYLGQIGAATPLLLALGTHDGESARYDDGSDTCLAVWSQRLRTRYYPNPLPDDFYTGNRQPDPRTGPLQDYYAFTWGDALLVVLDPFRYSLPQRNRDGWGWSLGRTQYEWLDHTLAASPAKFKFVFIHNLLSGDQASRGGVEIARRNEWGGQNLDGSAGFATQRPGWATPVAELLARHGVAAVFKAHDNFYARQELAGIQYIMVPQPSFAGDDRIRDLSNYGYQKGVFLGNPGHVRVIVSPQSVSVTYVKTGATPATPPADTCVITAR